MGLFDKIQQRRAEENERKLKETLEELEKEKAELRKDLKRAGFLDDEAIEDFLRDFNI